MGFLKEIKSAVAKLIEDSNKDVREKATATVVLEGFGEKKINVLKAVKEIMGLGLMEAKTFVEALPKPVVEDADKEKAEEVKKKLEEAGGTVSLK